MEASWKCERHLLSRALKAAVRLGKRPRGQLQGPGRGQQRRWVAQGESQGVEDTRTGQDLPPLKLLSTARLQDRSRQKWSKSDLRGKWQDLRGEG